MLNMVVILSTLLFANINCSESLRARKSPLRAIIEGETLSKEQQRARVLRSRYLQKHVPAYDLQSAGLIPTSPFLHAYQTYESKESQIIKALMKEEQKMSIFCCYLCCSTMLFCSAGYWWLVKKNHEKYE